jgi:hypothetical protein
MLSSEIKCEKIQVRKERKQVHEKRGGKRKGAMRGMTDEKQMLPRC